ncbi:MAG: 2-dehydropantoate 2-reductase [Candidatus Omnitrophota bacterium]|nr:2-dehydropantoate 2-reductase [Candidatus Omnitrophota bacterium]
MRIAVIGAGAIGGLVAGYLKLKGEEVFLVGHPKAVRAIKENGLQISGVREEFKVEIPAAGKLNALVDLIILATKTQDLEAALKANQPFLRGAVVLTTQNGVSADDIVALTVPKERIVSSIVMFGATSLEPGKITHNFEGSWIIGKAFVPNDAAIIKVSAVLNQIFPTLVSEEIKGMKMLKVFVNANNCIPALLGISMQEAFSDARISSIAMAVWREGLAVVKKAGVALSSLPDFPLERLEKLAGLPLAEAAKIYSGIMANLSKEPLYGSIYQSIKRGRPSEIDYINGEFVNLAKESRASAALNAKLTEMVHQVEGKKGFFTKDELINETRELLPG